MRLLHRTEVRRISLCTCYGLHGTDGAYDATARVVPERGGAVMPCRYLCCWPTRVLCVWRVILKSVVAQLWRLVGVQGVEGEEALTALGTFLCACYAVPGTDIAYASAATDI